MVGTGTIAIFGAASLKAAFVGEEQAHGHSARGVVLIRRRRPQVPTQHQAVTAGHRLGLGRPASGRQQFGGDAELLGVGFAQPGFVSLAAFWRGGGLVAGPVHRDLQPGGRRDEQAQANGAGEEHPPRRPRFTGAGVVSTGIALAFGGEVLAIEASELIVGRIIGAVAQAGFARDQETALVPAVGGAIEQLFAQLGCLLGLAFGLQLRKKARGGPHQIEL